MHKTAHNYCDCTSAMYCVAVGVLNYTVCMYQAVRMCACFCFILIHLKVPTRLLMRWYNDTGMEHLVRKQAFADWSMQCLVLEAAFDHAAAMS